MRKAFWYRAWVGLCAIVIVGIACLSPMMVSASYVSDHANNAQELNQIKMLYEAALRCMGSANRTAQFVVLDTERDDHRAAEASVKDAYNLNSTMWANDKGTLIYSATLEGQASSGYKDGKIYCSEVNLIPKLLTALGKYTTGMRDGLICNGASEGLYSVESGYFSPFAGFITSSRPAGIPAQSDCAGNLNLLIDYIENRPNESIASFDGATATYPFTVRLTPSSNAASYFQKKIDEMIFDKDVKNFDALDDSTTNAMDYWRYYQAFEVGCGVKINNGNTTPPAASSSNMNAVYDAVTNKIYYHSDSEISSSKKIYYNVTDNKQLTCKELASNLGENAKDIALTAQYASIKKCIDDYKQQLDKLDEQIEKYNDVQIDAKGFKDYLVDKITKIRAGKFEPTEAAGMPVYFDLKKDMAKTFNQDKIHAGVDGKVIYNDELLSTIVGAFEEIANNVVMAANKVDIESKPDDATLDNFDKLVKKWLDELDRVESEINEAKTLLEGKRDLAEKSDNENKGADKIWDFDDSSLMVTCPGLDSLDKEIGNILSAAPPTIDTDWSGVEIDDPDYDSSNNEPISDMRRCLDNASSLGWVLCPTLRIMGLTAAGIWENVADKWLATDYQQYSADNSKGVYVAWGYIRNLTNIVFAVMLFMVIISQLSGIGISNYGIKKLLPTLIILIVVVNLSFLICQFLIDISNVVGASIEGIADTIRSQVKPELAGASTSQVFKTVLFTLLEAAGVVGAGAAVVAYVKINGMFTMAFLLPLAISLVGVLISIIFAFLILAIRQAGILILVVVSPLAFVCYALPNTKSLFDKWWKSFTSLLFVYPVCATMVYGGQIASSIMLASSNTGFMWNLVAMLLQIVPVFFIPSMIRGSLAIAGNIGNRVAQAGARLGNAVDGLRKSDTVQRLRLASQNRVAQRNRATLQRLSERKGLKGLINREALRRMDSNVVAYQKQRASDYQNALTARGYIDGNREADMRAAAAEAERLKGIKESESGYDANPDLNTSNTDIGGDVDTELRKQLARLAQEPHNLDAQNKVGALSNILLRDKKGRAALLRTTRDFAATHHGSAAEQFMAKHLSGENMAKIKSKGQFGLEQLVKDMSRPNQTSIQPLEQYGAAGIGDISAKMAGDIDVTALDSQLTAIQDANSNGLNSDTAKMQQLYDVYTQALSSPTAADSINLDSAMKMNEIRKELHARLGSTTPYVDIAPGSDFYVEREAPLPNGWKRTSSGSIKWGGGGSGPTEQDKINLQEWRKDTARVNINNSRL